MASFNTLATRAKARAPRGYIVSEKTPSGHTYNGAPGFRREPTSELFLLAVANFVTEDTYYEMASDRDRRFRTLVRSVACDDTDWTTRFIPWLRKSAHMRTASVVAALEAAYAMVAAKIPGAAAIVDSALQRPDEPGEAVAYCLAHYGPRIPKPIKRGIASAATRLYNEFSALKYDGPSSRNWIRFSHVLEITHPRASSPRQAALFTYLIARRYGREDLQQIVGTEEEPALPLTYANIVFRSKAAERPEVLLDSYQLGRAGMTWEDALSLSGQFPDFEERQRLQWEAAIPVMGYFALLRNLANFDKAGISEGARTKVVELLTDPEHVRQSQLFPYRFLSAYQATRGSHWADALERALQLSLSNVPELPGRTLVLVDRSDSMFQVDSRERKRSGMTRADQAAIFGTALALRNFGRADLVQFGSYFQPIQLTQGASVLGTLSQYRNLAGTDTVHALESNYKGHDRVVIITDEQADYVHDGGVSQGIIPAHVPFYTWNLAGYEFGHESTSGRHYTFGGLSDGAFRMIPVLEHGGSEGWPF